MPIYPIIGDGSPFIRSKKRSNSQVTSKRTARLVLIMVISAAQLALISCAKKVAVPDFSGQDVDQAEKTIASSQFKLGTVSGLQNGSAQGAYVQSQTPAAGQQAPIHTAIDLVAIPPVQVPDLSKSSVTDAVNALQSVGLKASLMKQPTNNIFSHGHVKQQSPAANTLVRRDSTVFVTVEAPPNLGSLLGLVTKEPAYEKLNPEYRKVLDEFLKQPDAGTALGTTASSAPAASTPPAIAK